MFRFIVQRILLVPVLLFLFSIVVFAIIQAPPGDFLTNYIATLAASGSSLDAAEIEMLERQFGLDQPVYIQYIRWMRNLLEGNLGLSLEFRRPNIDLISERLAPTLLLALFAFIFTWIVAIPVGIYSAIRRNSFFDYLFTVINYSGVAIPNFMMALILMWLAFVYFRVGVTGLFSPEFELAPWSIPKFIDMLGRIWLPMIILGVAGTARLARVLRSNLLDELNKPYMISGRARGLSEWKLVMKYPVRLAINPLVSTIGWYLPELFSGSLIVATVMNLQNIGPLLLRSLINQDMYLSGAILMIYCFLAIIGTLISDILLVWIDPRIRLEKSLS